MQKAESKIRVRYSETGKMGFAHHANYFNWFDLAQEELLKSYGLSYYDIESLGYRFVPIHTSCDFKAPAYYDDLLTVRVIVKEIKGIRLSFQYEIVREKDTVLIAVGESAHLLLDKNMHVAMIKDALPQAYQYMTQD